MRTRQCTLTLLTILLIIGGCKSQQPVYQLPPIRHIERTHTRLVPFFIPGDSLSLRAFFECDSLNNVLMTELEEGKSGRVNSKVGFKKWRGRSIITQMYNPTRCISPAIRFFIEKEIPYPVEVLKIEYKANKVATPLLSNRNNSHNRNGGVVDNENRTKTNFFKNKQNNGRKDYCKIKN